jgi:UDP-N-acetylglucosamine 4,6-dehydratase
VSIFANANVLITGGSGFAGRAIAQRALADGATRVALLSRDEAKQAKLRETMTDDRLRWFVGDVRDSDRLRWAMRGVDLVVHAAAMKRIDACESAPLEAIATNITGTENVAKAAIRAGVARAILLSTDKAAQPCTHYGYTKATAERLWIQCNTLSAGLKTKLCVSRYGNVLGSTGSVIPMWRAEVERTGCLTLTDPEATRFFMTVTDAVDLIALALDETMGGETFVPPCRAASVGELAHALCPDAMWRLIGLQHGEKRHECLISPDEASRTTYHATHYTIGPALNTWGGLPDAGLPVPADFALRSDTAERLTHDELRGMV